MAQTSLHTRTAPPVCHHGARARPAGRLCAAEQHADANKADLSESNQWLAKSVIFDK
ncbi:MAG: hypothetical protein IV104_13890 [Acidovorax sp.]|nr:hypothetical protein [Acidovorax sp.]